jgi:hypothetical protein
VTGGMCCFNKILYLASLILKKRFVRDFIASHWQIGGVFESPEMCFKKKMRSGKMISG